MAQGILLKYGTEKNITRMTALASLPVYLDLAKILGLGLDRQMVLSLSNEQNIPLLF